MIYTAYITELEERSYQCVTFNMEDLSFVYFADPYSSWQRGSNENANGLLREFFPKGTDFGKVSRSEIAQALAWINGRPRKCLNWKTAYEVFTEEVLHLI